MLCCLTATGVGKRATDQRASALVACWSLVNVEHSSAGPVGRVPVAVSGAPDSGGPSMCEGRQPRRQASARRAGAGGARADSVGRPLTARGHRPRPGLVPVFPAVCSIN